MLSKIVAVLAVVGSVIAQATVQTPAAIVQCQPVAINFSGGQSPYFLSIIPGGQTAAAALVDFGRVETSPYTWVANVPAGQSITIKIVDSAGVTSYSAPVTILNGTSSDCLNAATTTAASATTPEVTSTSTGSATAATTTASSESASTTAAASSSSTGRASSLVSSASGVASSISKSASSAVSSATSVSGAQATGVVQAGAALVVGILGGAAALL